MYSALEILAARSKLAVQTVHLTGADDLNHEQLSALGARRSNVRPAAAPSEPLMAAKIKPGIPATAAAPKAMFAAMR